MAKTRKSMSERMRTTDRRDTADEAKEPPEFQPVGARPRPRLRRTHRQHPRPPFDCIALLLQGGGALGDTGALKSTLERVIDFDRINAGPVRLDFYKTLNLVNNAVARLLDRLPDELKDSDEVRFLASLAYRHHVHNIVHIIYRPKSYEGDSKDYEFSRQSMEERWRDGYYDTVHTLRRPEVLERSTDELGGVTTFDFAGRD